MNRNTVRKRVGVSACVSVCGVCGEGGEGWVVGSGGGEEERRGQTSVYNVSLHLEPCPRLQQELLSSTRISNVHRFSNVARVSLTRASFGERRFRPSVAVVSVVFGPILDE